MEKKNSFTEPDEKSVDKRVEEVAKILKFFIFRQIDKDKEKDEKKFLSGVELVLQNFTEVMSLMEYLIKYRKLLDSIDNVDAFEKTLVYNLSVILDKSDLGYQHDVFENLVECGWLLDGISFKAREKIYFIMSKFYISFKSEIEKLKDDDFEHEDSDDSKKEEKKFNNNLKKNIVNRLESFFLREGLDRIAEYEQFLKNDLFKLETEGVEKKFFSMAVHNLFVTRNIFRTLNVDKSILDKIYEMMRDLLEESIRNYLISFVEIEVKVDNAAGKFEIPVLSSTTLSYLGSESPADFKILMMDVIRRLGINTSHYDLSVPENFSIMPLVLLNELLLMQKIEARKMGGVKELHERFGIIYFSRYDLGMLLDMLEDKKEYEYNCTVLVALRDITFSFHTETSKDMFRDFYFSAKSKGVKVVFQETGGERNLFFASLDRSIDECKGKKIDALIFVAHAVRDQLQFSESKKGCINAEDFLGEFGDDLKKRLGNYSISLFDSCGVGRRGGVGQTSSKVFDVSYAPKGVDAGLEAVSIDIVDGKPIFVAGYFSGKKREQPPHIYRNGKLY